jgi:hypothetical protein
VALSESDAQAWREEKVSRGRVVEDGRVLPLLQWPRGERGG